MRLDRPEEVPGRADLLQRLPISTQSASGAAAGREQKGRNELL